MVSIPADQFYRLRKNTLAKALVKSFEDTRQTAAIEFNTGDVLATDARGHSLRFGFDQQGFIGAITSPLCRKWLLKNNAQGKLEELTIPSGLRVGLEYDGQGQLSSASQDGNKMLGFEYDDYGNLARIHHPDGGETRLDHWGQGRLAKMTNRLGHVEQYRYDELGNLIAIIDGNGSETRFEYGGWNRPSVAHFADGRSEAYAYDTTGRVVRIASDGGRAVELGYQGENPRPARIGYADGEFAEFIYDDQGRILEARNAEAVARFVYAADGSVLQEEVNGNTVHYHYDEVGSLVGIGYPSGDGVRFSYDADMRLAAVEDWNKGQFRWGYDQSDRALAVRYPNQLVTYTWQNGAGLSEAVEVVDSAKQRVFAQWHSYDSEGRRTGCLDSDLGRKGYVYDRDGQLLAVQAEQPEQSEQFAYDLAGNRTQCNGEAAEFDAANRLLRQGGTRFLYDAHGDLAQWQGGGQAWRYTWNSREQLVRAQSSDGRVVSFGYDAFGRRLWKRSGNRTNPNQTETRFHWAGEHLIGEETWASGERVATQEYLYLPGTHTPLATRINGCVYFYHCDPLGTPQRLTDGQGRVVWLAESKAFGSTDIKLGEIPNPLRLPGQYYDAETGLHYNRFRYHSPEWGRYMSKDPLAQTGGLNLYAYVGNNPLNQADPMGLWWKAAVSIVAAVAVGIAVVALAPVALPVAIVLAGIAAGAVGAGLNEALNQETFCFPCILKAMARGGLVGGIAALPFAFLPAAAGIAAYMGVGGLSGGMGYTADFLLGGHPWSWQDFGTAVGVGALTAGAGRYLGPKISKLWQREQPPNSNKTEYGELRTKEPCFLAGTMIKTPQGNIPIEIICIGDKVLAYNIQEKRTEEKEVKKLYINWTNVYYDIVINGKSIFATSRHLFWSVDYSKWIPAKDIKVNQQLKTLSGN